MATFGSHVPIISLQQLSAVLWEAFGHHQGMLLLQILPPAQAAGQRFSRALERGLLQARSQTQLREAARQTSLLTMAHRQRCRPFCASGGKRQRPGGCGSSGWRRGWSGSRGCWGRLGLLLVL